MVDGLPAVVDRGYDLLRRFSSTHGSTDCRAIRGDARVPLACTGVVRQAPELCAQSLDASDPEGIPGPIRRAYRELFAHWADQGFHCAAAVFDQVGDAFGDDVNAFNRAMNLGHELAQWFEGELGSTQCRALTGCDFATAEGVHDYIARGCLSACAGMAGRVSSQVVTLSGAGP